MQHIHFFVFLLNLLPLHHLCLQNHTSLISSSHFRLFFIHPRLLSPIFPFSSETFSPSLPPSLPCSFLPFFTLPWWYLIAVKQEAGEQTAGEATLILSWAICCCHVTELQTRSNAMMPHHTWHIDQSWPKSKRESERARKRKMKRNHNNIRHWMSYKWNSAYYDSFVLSWDFSFSSRLFGIIITDCICHLLVYFVKIWCKKT